MVYYSSMWIERDPFHVALFIHYFINMACGVGRYFSMKWKPDHTQNEFCGSLEKRDIRKDNNIFWLISHSFSLFAFKQFN